MVARLKQTINHQYPAKDSPTLSHLGSDLGSTVNLFTKWRTHQSKDQLPPLARATPHKPPNWEKQDPFYRSP